MGSKGIFTTGSGAEETLGLIESLIAELRNPELWFGIGTNVLFAIVLIVIAGVIVKVLNRIIENYFTFTSKEKLKGKKPKPGNAKRNKTLINVLQNAVSIVIWFIVFVMVLETFGVPVATLLAGAGVVGVAVAAVTFFLRVFFLLVLVRFIVISLFESDIYVNFQMLSIILLYPGGFFQRRPAIYFHHPQYISTVSRYVSYHSAIYSSSGKITLR